MILAQSNREAPKAPSATPIGIAVHIFEREEIILGAIARAATAVFPTLKMQLDSAERTNFYLMPTACSQVPSNQDGSKINSCQSVGILAPKHQMGIELQARNKFALHVGASHVQHHNSHVCSFHFANVDR